MCRALILVLLVGLLAACEPPTPRLSGSGSDMFAPVSIRLHPLSRLLSASTAPATQPAGATLEARLEFSDQFGDPGKGAGTVDLRLFDQPPLVHKGRELGAWTLDLQTPVQQRDHWDRTTRTYLFRLPLKDALPKRDHLLVVATLTLSNGAVYTDEIELPGK